MDCFISDNDNSILLVGEGNFSFSIDFVDYIEKNFESFFSQHKKNHIISTCFEPEHEISTAASVNAKLLQEKGIQVEFDIDARCLEQYAFRSAGVHLQSFSRVVFNFPHVGGKMRIERNRKLLRDFLVSASQVVQPDGVVCVSLCAGQGGSTVENGAKTQRRWDDSWKAVEAAGEAGMLLTAVLPFPPTDILPQYTSTGYRGLQKGFHLTDARVHIFRFNSTPLPHPLPIGEMNNAYISSIVNPYYTLFHIHKINLNPWKNPFSLQSKFLVNFISHTSLSHKLIDEIIVCDGINDFRPSNDVDLTIRRCLILNELSNDFSKAPVECSLKLFTGNAYDVASKTLESVLGAGDFDRFLRLGSDCDVTILVDRLLDGDWRKLWTSGVACVSPRSYTLDVTFSVTEVLCEQRLVDVLWVVGGDFIVDLKRLSVFVFEEGTKMNYCYRIVYRSYQLPLFKARIIDIHNKVIVRAVEYFLDATVV